MKKFVMALDQGTTSSRCIIFGGGRIIASAQNEYRQIYPRAGWVEHDPADIWDSQYGAAKTALERASLTAMDIAAIGITNQRETSIMWDRSTGEPVGNAIVWQCRRTAALADSLKARGMTNIIAEKTGLIPDAYFSATKIMWMLDNIPGLRERAERGELAFGTPDSWLIWKLTGGREHITDYTNASRTMLFNIRTLDWDCDLLKEFGIPRSLLPTVVPSSGVACHTAPELFGEAIPIAGIAGDQQAALFGQDAVRAGMAKNTYGTGCFLLMNIGDKFIRSQNGLLTTLACDGDGKPCYALEGSVFSAGSAIQWLRDGLGLISSASESEPLAASVPDTNGVYLVPAFTGLGAPWWKPDARGIIVNLTRGATKAHIVRAALEAIAYQSRDVLELMESETGAKISALKVDGGASANNFLMRFQADIADCRVIRPACVESTALGAAKLAAKAVGIQVEMNGEQSVFEPQMEKAVRDSLNEGWHRAAMKAIG